MKLTHIILIAVKLVLAASIATAQSADRASAIKNYLEGKDLEAVVAMEELLKQKQYENDAELVNYLGLAYQNSLDSKRARKMFEKAVKLQPANSTYRVNLAYAFLLERKVNTSQRLAEKALQLDPSNISAYYVLGKADLWEKKYDEAMATANKMIGLGPDFAPGYTLKSEVLIANLGRNLAEGSTIKAETALLKEAVGVLEAGLQNGKQSAYRRGLEERLESMRAFLEHYTRERPDSAAGPPVPEPGVTPVKILSKRPARYTDSARAAGVQGSIRLAVILGANGQVQHILTLRGLGYGLDEQAHQAAAEIRFIPKMKNGVPVTTVVTLEYSFSIY